MHTKRANANGNPRVSRVSQRWGWGSEVRGVSVPAHTAAAAAVVLMSNVSGTAAKAAGG